MDVLMDKSTSDTIYNSEKFSHLRKMSEIVCS